MMISKRELLERINMLEEVVRDTRNELLKTEMVLAKLFGKKIWTEYTTKETIAEYLGIKTVTI